MLQDFHLISLDTFREYRYPDIIQGNTTVTGYDCDESVYKCKISEEMKKNRLMFLSLFVTDTMDNMSRLLSVYPELEDIVRDMGQYLSRPEEVLNMFSESLRILDKNSMDLLIDEAIERAEKAEADAERAEANLKRAEEEAKIEKAKNEKAQQEIAMLKKELAKLKQQ